MYSKNKKNKNLGFSLLELILAIAIFSLGSFAIATLLIDSNISTKLSMERTEALIYAREGIETAKFTKNNAWEDLVSTTTVINDKYTRMVNVTEGSSSSTKNVSVTVTWYDDKNVILNTVMTNWRGN